MDRCTLLEDLLLQFYAALTGGDLAALDELVAANAPVIGTDPRTHHRGRTMIGGHARCTAPAA